MGTDVLTAPRVHRGPRRGQALLGVLVGITLLSLLTAGVTMLGRASGQGGAVALRGMTAMPVAEAGLNSTYKILADTINSQMVQNLWLYQTLQSISPWVSDTSWSGIQSGFTAMMRAVSPFTVDGSFPQELASSQASAYVSAAGTASGPGGMATWYAIVGLIPVRSPVPATTYPSAGSCPGSPLEVITFPIAVRGHAWVWGPDGTYLGEVTLYSSSPGAITMTWNMQSGGTATGPGCVQATLPGTSLLLNDPNVSTPPHP